MKRKERKKEFHLLCMIICEELGYLYRKDKAIVQSLAMDVLSQKETNYKIIH